MKLHFKRFCSFDNCGSWEPCRVCEAIKPPESFTIYLHKNPVHDSPISHPADRQTVTRAHQSESLNSQRACCAVNLAERTSVKGSDRAKSRKPGNVKSQKSVEALKSKSLPAEASLSSLPLQETQWNGKETAGRELTEHLDSSFRSHQVLEPKQTLHKLLQLHNINSCIITFRNVSECNAQHHKWTLA